MDTNDTSWESVTEWYDKAVGKEGHYYHQNVILPNLLKLITLKKDDHFLDLACGQGILARQLPKKTAYTGVDLSRSLIEAAKKHDPTRNFLVHDITAKLPLEPATFTHAAIVLALQNVAEPQGVFANASRLLRPGGTFFIVLNHPCFRIPRQSSWEIDEPKKLQYRRIDRYMSLLKIPIQMNPGRGEKSANTVSFHRPLSYYSRELHAANFTIDLIEEWCSDKVSTGKAAKMENRAREEIPLFLCIVAKKLPH